MSRKIVTGFVSIVANFQKKRTTRYKRKAIVQRSMVSFSLSKKLNTASSGISSAEEQFRNFPFLLSFHYLVAIYMFLVLCKFMARPKVGLNKNTKNITPINLS